MYDWDNNRLIHILEIGLSDITLVDKNWGMLNLDIE